MQNLRVAFANNDSAGSKESNLTQENEKEIEMKNSNIESR
jgi:hypothetical protein